MAKLIWKTVGNWANSTQYVCGDLSTDPISGVGWYCAIEHISAAAGSFEDERTAEPTFWRLGLQVIDSAIKEIYDASLTPNMPGDIIRKRYPWQKPSKQEGGSAVTQNELEQRSRWLEIRNKFKNLSLADRAKWYNARPVWHSLLWYYNYFMMSGLTGNAEINGSGAGVIKDIHHYTFQLPAGTSPSATVAVDLCDPLKSVPFFFGAGYHVAAGNIPVANYPFLISLNSSSMVIGGSLPNEANTNLSVTLIEYI